MKVGGADNCAHCELPLGGRFASATIGGESLHFCCYGCVLAQQVTRASGEPGAAAVILVRLGLGAFCAMNVMALSLPTYAPYVYTAADLPTDGPLFQILRLLSAAFALPVIVLLGGPIVLTALRGLRDGVFTADALIVLGAAAAYALSLAHVLRGGGEVYFDTAAMLLVIVTLGRYLEARAKSDATSVVKRSLCPTPERALRLIQGRSQLVPSADLVPGDMIRVTPGDAFPTDGMVLSGIGAVDESALTGESRPIRKDAGARVAGGTCSIDGTFEVLVSAQQRDSAAARIAALLADAMRRRGRIERLADRAAQVLVPLVIVIALATGIGWTAIAGVDHGLLNALSVLVVACPCALGIATPVALWMGLLLAARRGVVVRNAASLECAAAVERVLFDKTGTLTTPQPILERVVVATGRSWTPERALAVAGALEANLTHPMARAVAAAAARVEDAEPAAPVVGLRVIPGNGVQAEIDGTRFTIGSSEFAAADLGKSTLASSLPVPGPATTVLWDPAGPIASFSFREQPRDSAVAALSQLQSLGLSVGLLSGDHHLEAIVPKLIAARDAIGGLSAEAKLDHVRAQRRGGAAVAMVGDGLNDAPALAAAGIGIAVGAATDLARISADVIVLGDDLRALPWLFTHARRVRRVMLQNLGWAGTYNLIAIGMAAMGKLNPMIAAIVMVASSILVVANSRRLLTPGAVKN